ncbi:hypothetical protein GWI33_012386 [Rhynchophorus ferrugineus]|uniref:Uncharacterized protein n=1 Tax=Rhynchophorus ferrugineus TaxID=354439 RepID=A0A834MAY3_RHYFE|nr:hypothetical protein GWI33_012386 [Rhynchophorus ferrugineus]
MVRPYLDNLHFSARNDVYIFEAAILAVPEAAVTPSSDRRDWNRSPSTNGGRGSRPVPEADDYIVLEREPWVFIRGCRKNRIMIPKRYPVRNDAFSLIFSLAGCVVNETSIP